MRRSYDACPVGRREGLRLEEDLVNISLNFVIHTEELVLIGFEMI